MPKDFKYDVIKLIENVKDRPCIWDRTLECYKNREDRKPSWEEIFRDLEPRYDEMSWEEKHTTGELIVNKWTNLRDTFVKTLKPKMGKPKKKYVYHRQLAFLLKLVPEEEYANTEFNAEGEGTAFKHETIEEPNYNVSKKIKSNEASMKSKRANSHNDYVPKSKRKRSQDSSYVAFETDTSNDIDFVGVDSSDLNGRLMNEDEAFFASLLPAVVKYNEDEKLEFRIEVLSVMKKIKDKRNWKVDD